MKSKSPKTFFILGITLLITYIALWLVPSGGMGVIFGLPFFVFGVLFMLKWFTKKEPNLPTIRQRWDFALQLLLINYTILYIISIAGNFISVGSNIDNIDVFSWPGFLLAGLLALFIVGFFLSWKRKLFAGVIFIIWFAGVTWARSLIESNDLIFFNMTAAVILLQGILYIAYHFKKLS